MDYGTHLAHLRRELDAFHACLDGDLSAPIEHCGDWTLHDLAEHMGRENLWVVAAVTEKRGDFEAPPAPREQAALLSWFDGTRTALLEVLAADPSTEAWTFAAPHTVGFWRRRRCLETVVHRWDAENALGTSGSVDPALAADGVAEVFEAVAPRQIARGRAAPPACAIRLHAADTGASVSYGPGEPVAAVTGTAEHLLLMLWGRLPSSDAALTWTGDRQAGQRVLDGPLVA